AVAGAADLWYSAHAFGLPCIAQGRRFSAPLSSAVRAGCPFPPLLSGPFHSSSIVSPRLTCPPAPRETLHDTRAGEGTEARRARGRRYRKTWQKKSRPDFP